MCRHLTFFLLAGCVALSACRSKPKKKSAELPEEPPKVGNSGSVRLRAADSAADDRRKLETGAKPKTHLPEATKPTPPPKPPAEAKPAVVEKPVSTPANPAAPKANTAADAKADSIPQSPPAKTPVVTRPAPSSAPTPVVEAQKGSQPPAAKAVTTAPTQSQPSNAAVPPAVVRTVKPADGQPIELSVPAKAQPAVPVAEPLRTTIPAAPVQAKPAAVGPLLGVIGSEPIARPPDARPLHLPSGGRTTTGSVSPAPPLALQFGHGTNQPTATNEALRAIGVDPLTQSTAWREQQLARQAAEQKAREEERQKLNGALFRFLLKGGSNR